MNEPEPAAPARRRRLSRGAVVAIVGVAALLAAFLVGDRLGGGDRAGAVTHPPAHRAAARTVAFRAGLAPARSCEDLLASYVRRGLRLVGAWGWRPSPMIRGGVELNGYAPPLAGAVKDLGLGDTVGTRAATERQESSATGTNVQEQDVDEPDTVKTDGTALAEVHGDELWLYDVAGSAVRRLSSLPLEGVDDPQLLMSGDTLVVTGRDADLTGPSTRVLTIDVSDPRHPRQTHDIAYRATLLSARQHGDAIRLVLDAGLPRLRFVQPRKGLDVAAAARRNRALVRASTIGDWLPTVATDGGPAKQLLDCDRVAVPDDHVGLGTITVVGFDASTPTDSDAIGLAGDTSIAYESASDLYLVSAPAAYSDGLPCDGLACGLMIRTRTYDAGATDGRSHVFDLALHGDRAEEVAVGEVAGRITDRWSMDEAGGVLRVAVAPTSQTGDFTSVVTLRRVGQDLVESGRLDGLGRGEDLESVRWFDDLAVLVTYRRLDPMYAVDLSHPAHPRLLGRLRMPGFSSYLHPLGPRRMIGVGTGPRGWTQVGLFDTSHLRHLRRLDVRHFSGTSPLAATDPRAFTWVPWSRSATTVVERYAGRRIGFLATLAVRDSHLRPHLTRVAFGDDVGRVRVVPLADGRAVLVAGDVVRFLHLEPKP